MPKRRAPFESKPTARGRRLAAGGFFVAQPPSVAAFARSVSFSSRMANGGRNPRRLSRGKPILRAEIDHLN
jgi:hypothetical protein